MRLRLHRKGRVALGLALTMLAASAATPARAAGGPCGWRSKPPDHWDHVIWVWMENHTYHQVVDQKSAPFTTWLAHQCGSTTRYSSVGGPSLPNYIGATSGDTHGIHDDGDPADHRITSDNLFRQVRRSGHPSRTYAEGMPHHCTLNSTGRYAVRHNPATYYVGENDRSACWKDNTPLDHSASQLRWDVDHWSLGAFAVVVPNLCDDTHDCDVAVGDRWLGSVLPRIWTSDLYKDGKTAIFVVWDEPTPMPNLVISPSTPSGKRVGDKFDHYSLLRTTEEMLHLPLLGHARKAGSMRRTFRL